jgi:hypothetical protein
MLSFAMPQSPPQPMRTQTPRSVPDLSASPSLSSQSSGGHTPSPATGGSDVNFDQVRFPQFKCAIMQTNKNCPQGSTPFFSFGQTSIQFNPSSLNDECS